MTNYEKYRDKLIKSNYSSNAGTSEFCNNFVEPNILNPIGKRCLDVDCTYCRMLMSIWLMDEYKEPKEPEVDWSKISVDTKVYVKDNEKDKWIKRYFAKYEKGKVYTWMYGNTSWISDGIEIESWEYAKLAENQEKSDE